MTHETTIIDLLDLSAMPDLARLAREVHRTRRSIVLRDKDEDVAVLSPAAPKRRMTGTRITEADIAASLAAAGSWKGVVDTEQLKRDLDAARSDDRPPVEL